MNILKEKNLRKLEETDITDMDAGEGNHTSNETYIQDVPYVPTPGEEPESGNATAKNEEVNATKPVATKPKTTEKKNANVQITKFHGFNAPRGKGKIFFGIYFYFLGRPIVKYIIMRLRITYSSKLRNLQTETAKAESVRTDCEIADKALEGKILSAEEGQNVNYNCETNAAQGDASTANFTLNTDIPMTMVNANGAIESLNFSDINFNGDSADESTSLQNNAETINNLYTLKNTIATVDKPILILTGKLENSNGNLELSEKQIITMNFKDNSNVTKTYNCTINGLNLTENRLICNTSDDPITTSIKNLHLSSGISNDNSLLTIEMKDSKFSSVISTEDVYIAPAADSYDNNTASNQAEKGNSTAEDATVNADKPVSTKGHVTDKKDAEFQVMKFHSFKALKEQKKN